MKTKTCLKPALICGGVLALAVCLAPPALASFFDVFGTGVTEGPPYPSTPPIMVHVTDNNTPPKSAYIEDIAFTFSDEAEMSANMVHCRQVHASGGGGSPATKVDFQYLIEPGTEDGTGFEIESFFDIFAPDGLTAVGIPGPVSYTESFFDVFLDVQFSDGGVMKHHLHGQIPPGQDLVFTDVGGVLVEPSLDYRKIRWTWEIDGGSTHGDPRASLPLMIVELTGSYVSEPGTLGLMAIGGLLCLGAAWRKGMCGPRNNRKSEDY